MTDLDKLAARLEGLVKGAVPSRMFFTRDTISEVAKELREMQGAPCPYCGEVLTHGD